MLLAVLGLKEYTLLLLKRHEVGEKAHCRMQAEKESFKPVFCERKVVLRTFLNKE
jgi:hypothetical protein